MRPAFLLLAAIGVLLAIGGSVFTLQGMGIVGPDNGFMFNNPAWIYQGVATAVIGLLLLAGGILLGRKKR
jgi:LPXTG-motif cell wall-anchored protein